MHNFAIPRMCKCASNLQRDVECIAGLHRSRLVHQVANVVTVDVFEDYVPNSAVLSDVVRPRNIRVVETGCGTGFDFKPPLTVAVAALSLGEHLYRDRAVKVRVPSAKDCTHPAAADEFLEQHMVELLSLERSAELTRIEHCRGRSSLHRRR